MTYQIYSSQKTEQNLRQGPLGAYVDELVTVFLQNGYVEKYIRPRFAVVSELNRWLIRKEIRLCDLNQSKINEFFQYRSNQTSMSRRGEKTTLDLLLRLLYDHRSIPTKPAEKIVDDGTKDILGSYRQYLVEDKGLSYSAITSYVHRIHQFLLAVFRSKPLNFASLYTKDITEFVRKYATKYSPKSSALMVSSLRSFFRFLLLRGEISVDLAACVPTVANRKHTHIPQYLTSQELEQLLTHSAGQTALQLRNYAILLLLSRLGFRACEVVKLTLDDLDWEHGEIIVRGKGKETRFPLPVDVGQALVAYLKYGRPSCPTRRFFISSKAPRKPLTTVAVSTIVHTRLQKAGLNTPKKGAHLLRHTLATECLRKGASLSEIGQILRHEHIDTTAIYAKVDFERLRTIVQPWPDASFFGGAQ